jgi:hypothetical protein
VRKQKESPFHWDFSSGKTWGYMIGGGLTGLASSYAGLAVAGVANVQSLPNYSLKKF